jgi:alpha-beta hydrolase superfamily lysophospholipase
VSGVGDTALDPAGSSEDGLSEDGPSEDGPSPTVEVRGTVVVLLGAGERADDFTTLTDRLVLDGYRVELFDDVSSDVRAVRAGVERLVRDRSLPRPVVLLGSDVGATLAASVAVDSVAAVDAVVLTGVLTPASRRGLGADRRGDRAGRALPTGLSLPAARSLVQPTLVFHGDGDRVTEVADAVAWAAQLPRGSVRLVGQGGHDVLRGPGHRTVTASIVLFLERQRSDDPVLVDAFAARTPRPT